MSYYPNRISIPLDSIKDASESINLFCDNNIDLFDQIVNLVNAVNSNGEWKGKGVASLIAASESNSKKYAQAMQELRDLAKFLSDYAEKLKTEDSNIKSEIQGKMR